MALEGRDPHVIKAVLFDMDDTLLDINLEAFVVKYLAAMSRVLGQISRRNPLSFGIPTSQSYLAISSRQRVDDLTNKQLFVDTFRGLTGIPLDDPLISEAISCYERELLPSINDGVIHAQPRKGGRKTVEKALSMGLTVALATNPSFSADCVRCRMGWAGIDDIDFARISHLGNSTRVKPSARYFGEFVAALGLRPQECVMVGNDASRDFPRPDCGLRTAYVGHGWPRRALWRGDMANLADQLPVLIESLDSQA